ncbi:MAG TPA: ABC transporter permease [Acidobacteriaceae bacterium]|jgi:ABC-2 type transport system permease protein|nr:ABC transporter permease [Acidobacteriaceae bacterium]
MGVIYILWLRELKRYSRSRAQMIASLGQPLLYLLALGFGLGPVYRQAGHGSYIQFLAPGVIGMTVLFSAIFSGMGLLWDRQFGFLKETLVAPVPRLIIMAGRTLGGATVAICQGLLVTIVSVLAGFRPVSLAMVPVGLAFMVMIAIVFAALGTAIGSALKDMQGFQMTMNFLVMPIFFLSGALFPLTTVGKVLHWITIFDPLAYGIDGMRSTLLSAAQSQVRFGPVVDGAVLVGVALLFLSLGAYSFSKIEI